MNDDVTIWIGKLKEGDEDAARMIWERFFHRIQGLAQKKLGSIPRRESDAEDLALSAINALCVGAREGKFRQLEDRQDLWQLLAMITSRKAAQSWRRQTRRGEVGESVFQHNAEGLGMQNIAADSPQFLDTMHDACRDLLAKLDSDRLREVAMLRLSGYSNAEIAAKLDRSEKSIERYLQLIRASWSAERDAE